jgi:hypothetical protein
MLVAQSPVRWPIPARIRLASFSVCGVLALAFCLSSTAQQAPAARPGATPEATPPEAAQQTAPDTTQNPTQVPTAAAQTAAPETAAPLPGEITEDELKHMLLGKQLFLRGDYMDNDLRFNELGTLIGHSPQGSFTLSEIQIERVRLTKHKVELEGIRYGLHFLGALASEDSSTAVEPLRITPKKKVLKITIDREQVLVRKKKEAGAKGKERKAKPAPAAQTALASSAAAQPALATATATASQAPPAATEPSEADQLKASIAAAPAAERPADPASVTTTYSPAHAANLLRGAIDRIFAGNRRPADGLNARLLEALLPGGGGKSRLPAQGPRRASPECGGQESQLLSKFQPESNEYAQANAVSGMALYHAVIGADGKPQEIAVGRPIGFGLDENAVQSIRKASFEPAIKDGKPVPVLLDLVVEFHIYSKRTAAVSKPEDASKPAEPLLPGPYSVQHP